MKVRLIIAAIFVLLWCPDIVSQNNAGTGPRENSVKAEMSERKKKRRDARERRKKEKEEQKAIKKHHKKLQTKAVQKRMKQSRKTAIRNNEHRREPFYKRWFRKKNRPSGRTKD